METQDGTPLVTEPLFQRDESQESWVPELLNPDPFEAETFIHENRVNGTTKEEFTRWKSIDQKNLVLAYVGEQGRKWDGYGECTICKTESYLRCEKCPWVFYCTKVHQIDDWINHCQTCMNVCWYADGHARATKDLPAETEIMEISTIFVAPRFHTPCEILLLSEVTAEEDFAEATDTNGPLLPCFGCHELIQPFLSSSLVCTVCKFPMHCRSCELSPWHRDECNILKRLNVKFWFDEIGRRDNIMIHLAVLRGILLKKSHPLIWTQILALDSKEMYMTSPDLTNATINFIVNECKVEWMPTDEIVQFLTIFMKHRLNCCLASKTNKKMVSVICSGMIPFTLVKDEDANVQGGVYNYRMRMTFHIVKPVVRGEILTIGRGGF